MDAHSTDLDAVERLRRSCAALPDAPAVEERGRVTTYREFMADCDSFAAYIARATGTRTALHLTKGRYAYAAMYGALIAGGFYCPLDRTAPAFRRKSILDDFSPSLIIADDDDIDELRAWYPETRVVSVEDARAGSLSPPATANELAYVIYTSGSTGRPKGVMIRRRALNHFLAWSVPAYGAQQGDRWGQFSSLGFDLSVVDIFTALSSGATLVPLVTSGERLFPGRTISERALTIWHSVPSVIDLMSQAQQVTNQNLASIRLMSFCGEPLRPQHLDQLFSANQSMLVFNTYGPTEGTLFCTWQPLHANTYREFCRATCSIGSPLPGWDITLAGDGPDEGEIVISGEYIGAGYWTAVPDDSNGYREKPVEDRVVPLYRTGDWAQRIGSGLYFSGRRDRQVKYHGHRIELDEIDFHIREYGIENSRCLLEDNQIVAFLETKRGLDQQRLAEYLRGRLPSYCLPKKVVIVEEFPRNSSDKVDLRALRDLLSGGQS